MPIVWVFMMQILSSKYFIMIQNREFQIIFLLFFLPFSIRKSAEYLRLIDLKAPKIKTNQTAKLILCIEWASIVCGTDLDHREAVKLSALTEIDYNRQKDLIDKFLNLSKKLTLDEICAQLEINDRLKNDARQLYNEYQAKRSYYNDDDTNSVPILAMAIYQSLKLRKVKSLSAIKTKLVQLSKLKPIGKWKQLEDEWDKWIEKCAPLKMGADATAAANDNKKTDGKGHQNESKCKPIYKKEDDNAILYLLIIFFLNSYFQSLLMNQWIPHRMMQMIIDKRIPNNRTKNGVTI